MRVELGRRLFYDTRLSVNEKRSCGICHEQAKGFTDGFPRAVGTTNELLQRTTPTLSNVSRRDTLLWAPLLADPNSPALDLHAQVLRPLFTESPVEMGMGGENRTLLIQRLDQDETYPYLFEAAFPGEESPVSIDGVVSSIVAFEETLVSDGSDYDRYLRGDGDALGPEALRGLALFQGPRLSCFRCHSGADLDSVAEADGHITSRHGFFNTGLYDVDGQGAYPDYDQGRFAATGEASDMGRFRTPTLRNVEVTGPYAHDGSVASLEDMVQLYAAGGRNNTSGPNVGDGRANPYKHPLISGFTLSESELSDVVAFLRSLTDRDFLSDPALSNPFSMD